MYVMFYTSSNLIMQVDSWLVMDILIIIVVCVLSAQRPAVVSPPEVLMNQWLPGESPVADTEESQQRTQQNQVIPPTCELNH